MKRIAASVLLLAGLAACGGDGGNNEGATAEGGAQSAAVGPDSATPVEPGTPQDSAFSRAVAGSPAAGNTLGKATAKMMDATRKEIGELALAEVAEGVEVTGQLRGLPAGEHAIHIHMVGSCTPPFTSAGGHWNPNNKAHGSQAPNGPHQGDLPNLTADASGNATIRGTAPGAKLTAPMGVVDTDGGAVVVHANPDDYKSQPAGNAGDRIACGVVQMGT